MSKYIFTSKRLGFRPYTTNDFENILRLDGNITVRAFFPNGALNSEQVKININKIINFYNKHGFGFYIIEDINSQEFIGRCGFGKGENFPEEIEIGYVLLEKFWGLGMATEALKALLKISDKVLPKNMQVVGVTPKNHIASQQVMEKCGMKQTGCSFTKNNVLFVTYQK